MKRLLTSLLLLLLVVFLGFKAAVWWLADRRMAEARMALEQHGVLERGSIASRPGGQLVLQNAYWQDFRLTRPLEFARLEFDAGSPLALLQALADPLALPPFWTLRAEGMELALDASMFRNWVTADGDNNGETPALIPLPCGPDAPRPLASADLIRMGITRLSGEMLVRQDAQGLHVELDTFATGSLEVTWPGLQLTLADTERLFAGLTGPLQVTVRDGGLVRRLSAYCAREAGLDLQRWTTRAEEALVEYMQARGVRPSDSLLGVYRSWLLEGGEVSLSLYPRQPWWGIPLRNEEKPVAADWELTYNGEAISGLHLELLPAPVVVTTEPEAEPVADTSGMPEDQGWYAQALADAGLWLGYPVRVTLNNGKVVEGRLQSADEQELAVARSVGGGEVVYPILPRAVSRLEIWRRLTDQGGAEPPGDDG